MTLLYTQVRQLELAVVLNFGRSLSRWHEAINVELDAGARIVKAPAADGGRYRRSGYFTRRNGPSARASIPAQ
jgi:hypothetical protein